MAMAALAQPVQARRQVTQAELAQVRLTSAAAKVKAVGAVSGGSLAARGMIPSGAQATLAMPGFDERATDTLLRLFFSTAQIMVGHAGSATPIVAYYSPTLDLWWLTRWTGAPNAPLMAEGKIVPGGSIATGGRSASPQAPRWFDRLGRSTFIEALRETTQGAYAEFRAEFSPAAREAPRYYDRIETRDKDLLRQRAAAFAVNIADFQDDRRLRDLYRETLRRLGNERPEPPPGLSPDARMAFARMAQASRQIRSGLGPTAAFQLQGRWFLVASGPSSGRFLFLAAIDAKANEPIARLSLLDTMAQERAL